MRRLALVFLAALALSASANADRGALTVEGGPAITVLSLTPPIGKGNGVLGTQATGLVRLRYALSNSLELTLTGTYEAPATYYHDGVAVATDTSGTFIGTLESRPSGFAAMAGGRYVRGFVWRFFAGVELGWCRRSFGTPDLINVSDPQHSTSYGLPLTSTVRTSVVVAPSIGVEWLLSDHVVMSLASQVEILVGGRGTTLGLVLPLTVGYSWYLP